MKIFVFSERFLNVALNILIFISLMIFVYSLNMIVSYNQKQIEENKKSIE